MTDAQFAEMLTALQQINTSALNTGTFVGQGNYDTLQQLTIMSAQIDALNLQVQIVTSTLYVLLFVALLLFVFVPLLKMVGKFVYSLIF
ncbi:MAG: hypothetical protein WCJ84_05510 [Candidatus Peregrinibacteria bacterium]